MHAFRKMLSILTIFVWVAFAFAGALHVPVAAAPLPQEEQPANPIYLPVISQPDNGSADLQEPNETRATADGPLACGRTYIFHLDSETDQDWYYFDTTTLGKLNITLNEYDGENTQLNLSLYGAEGSPAAQSQISFPHNKEVIDFLPIKTGRYYLNINPATEWFTPGDRYQLRVTCSQPRTGTGDIYGMVKANGVPLANIPVRLQTSKMPNNFPSVYTVTGSDGTFHFWGMDSLGDFESHSLQFNNWSPSLGTAYVAFASLKSIKEYSAGDVYDGGVMDISPIKTSGPDPSISHELPVTLRWYPRATQPDERYSVYIVDNEGLTVWSLTGLDHSVDRIDVDYLGSYATSGETYNWYVSGSTTAGSASSHWTEITFDLP